MLQPRCGEVCGFHHSARFYSLLFGSEQSVIKNNAAVHCCMVGNNKELHSRTASLFKPCNISYDNSSNRENSLFSSVNHPWLATLEVPQRIC